MKILRFGGWGWLVLALLSHCSSKLERVETTNEYGYTERYRRDRETYAREGTYQRYNTQGELVEQAEYRNDSLIGERILFYENGDTQIVETYRNGAFEGPYRLYYEGGPVQQEGRYVNNVMEGEWKGYYPSGQLKEVVTFRNNTENGPFREWHENGQLKAEGTYRDGDNEHGELKLYDEQGELERVMNCDMGMCETTWAKEGVRREE